MRTRHALLLAAAAAAALFAPGPSAGAADGFVARRPLRVVPVSGQAGAEGGVEAWLRVTNGKRILQSFTVWFRGLDTSAGPPSLFMAKPGETVLTEVAAFAFSDNGSGLYQVQIDSSHQVNPELPLAVERVLDLLRAPVEVRLVSTSGEDVTVLRGSIGVFHYRDVDESGGGERVHSRRSTLRLPVSPEAIPDEAAAGSVRVFRKKQRGEDLPAFQGITLFASGLTDEEDYEVWVEDSSGDLQLLDVAMTTTPEGLGFFSLDTREDDDVGDLDVDDVRELYGRRVELRRPDSPDPSLVGLFPRVR